MLHYRDWHLTLVQVDSLTWWYFRSSPDYPLSSTSTVEQKMVGINAAVKTFSQGKTLCRVVGKLNIGLSLLVCSKSLTYSSSLEAGSLGTVH